MRVHACTRVCVKAYIRRSRTAASLAASAMPARGEGDMAHVVRAECSDVLLDRAAAAATSSSSSSSVTTQSLSLQTMLRIVQQHPQQCVLHAHNRPVWLALLPMLRVRGALTHTDCVRARRFVAAAVYCDLLPWLWSSSAAVSSSLYTTTTSANTDTTTRARAASKDAEDGRVAAAPPPHDDDTAAAAAAAAAAVQCSGRVEDVADVLATTRPAQWLHTLRQLLPLVDGNEASEGNDSRCASAAHARRRVWHVVLHSLTNHPAFAHDTVALQSAHAALLAVLQLFYADMTRYATAASLSPSQMLVLMPPRVLRHWRDGYRTQGALLAYGELVRACVAGEEAVLAAMTTATHACTCAYAQHNNNDGSRCCCRCHTAPTALTALLADEEMWTYMLTLPGRRDCALSWRAQWQLECTYASFVFVRVFRLLQYRLAANEDSDKDNKASSSSSRVCATTAHAHAWQHLQRAALAYLNVCVWVRNDNNEGERCVQAVRVLLAAYFASHATTTTTTTTSNNNNNNNALCVLSDVLRVVTAATVQAMEAKAERLGYGPCHGLLAVYTLAAALHAWRVGGAHDAHDVASSLMLLLHPSNATPACVWHVWWRTHATPTSTAMSRAVCDAVVLLLRRVHAHLLPATCSTASNGNNDNSRSNKKKKAATSRVLHALRSWLGALVAPLRLRARDADELLSLPCVTSACVHATRAAATAPALASWTCGCGHSNVQGERVACVACVCAHALPHAWQCTQCHWRADTSQPLTSCLRCGAAHPSLALAAAATQRQGAAAMTTTTRTAHDALHEPRLCYYCDSCAHYTVHTTVTRDGDGSCRCACCGDESGGDGYWTAYFVWQCGCGAVQPPSQAYCTACTQEAASAAAAAATGTAEAASTTHDVTATLLARYCCVACHRTVPVSLPHHDSGSNSSHHNSSASRRDALRMCPSCMTPHPRACAAFAHARLTRCTGCAHWLPISSAVTATTAGVAAPVVSPCTHCGSAVSGVLHGMRATTADRPWCCHACGYANAVRDAHGRLLAAVAPRAVADNKHDNNNSDDNDKDEQHATVLAAARRHDVLYVLRSVSATAQGADASSSSSSNNIVGRERCAHCHTARIPCEAWERGRRWSCGACGHHHNYGFACARCAQLATAVSSREVHLWCCAVCTRTLNASWQSRCSLPGCSGTAAQATRRVCYTPHDCTTCGAVTRSRHWPVCEQCGSATTTTTRDEDAATCALCRCAHAQCAQRSDNKDGDDDAACSSSNSSIVVHAAMHTQYDTTRALSTTAADTHAGAETQCKHDGDEAATAVVVPHACSDAIGACVVEGDCADDAMARTAPLSSRVQHGRR